MLRGWVKRLSGARAKAAVAAPAADVAAPPPAAQWKSRGNAALAAGQVAEAARCYEQGVLAAPDDAGLRLNAGFALLQQGRAPEAAERLQQAIALHKPGDGVAHDAWYLLGRAQAALGRVHDALASFGFAVRVKPDFGEPIESAARAAGELGRHEEAVAWARRLVEVRPDTDARVLLARALLADGRDEEALQLLERTCSLAPEHLDAAFLAYEALRRVGRMPEALAQAERVLQLTGPHPAALNNVAFVLEKLDRLDEALARTDQALALQPNESGALLNRVALLLQLGRVADARDAAREGLVHHPANANLHWNLGISHLLLGELREGWAEHEWRARSDAVADTAPDLPGRPWNGEDLAGRTLLVHGEQGFGDNIQFVRHVPELARRARGVLLQMPEALQPLMDGLAPHCRLLRAGELLPAFDFHCSVMSLPHRCGTGLDTIPAEVPYLRAKPAAVQAWRARLEGGRLNVGIAWAGRPSHANDRRRSMNLAAMRELAIEGCRLVSVQPDLGAADRALLATLPDALDAGRELRDFGDTAALLEALDLVISVDTSVAHLAGALGRPVWILLPFVPDWRWMLEREDSPWYPSARLFRQDATRDWAPVLRRVRAALEERRS